MQTELLHVFSDKNWAFGLVWLPVVGQMTKASAQQLCKQKKAQSWLIAGNTFLCVGLSVHRPSTKKTVYAAAVCYALLYPRGQHAAIYKITDAVFWVIAVQEGTPISQSDVLYRSELDAQQALESLISQYTELNCVLEVLPITGLLGSAISRPLTKALMQPLRQNHWKLVAACSLLVLLSYGWHLQAPEAEASEPLPEPDLYAEYWAKKKIVATNQDALLSLLQHWQSMPLFMAQWRLVSVDCQVIEIKWQCQHQYIPVVETAAILDFEAMLPQFWTLKEATLQKIIVQSSVDLNTVALAAWQSSQQVNLPLLSQLQPIRPAFKSIKLADPKPLFAKSVNPASTFSPIFSQDLNFDGPLRSIVLLLDLDEHVYWKKAALAYFPQAKAALKTSALQVSLQGVIYVRD